MKMGQSPLPCLPSPGDSSGQWDRATSSHWGVISGGQDLNNPLLAAFLLVLMTKATGSSATTRSTIHHLCTDPTRGCCLGNFIRQEGLNCRIDGNDIPQPSPPNTPKGWEQPPLHPSSRRGWCTAASNAKVSAPGALQPSRKMPSPAVTHFPFPACLKALI